MTTFNITSDDRTIEFAVTTTGKVNTHHGTAFRPNFCKASIKGGTVISLQLGLVDANGWGVDDPSGPDGAEMWADFGGGELDADHRRALPALAREALDAVKAAIA